ncbi:metallophosphoesterase family protein [Halogeometricum borinquense]|uniref:Phosphoesterase n=1 Tax=Halogeometricum borinquense TaxID=60847 RepID=A0A6C0UMU1_9EURY|nr:metallophosphoesterase family protein [Halogeometricum borinquense]QIB75893.1 metallophosphoesterase family protein [Halogeometricum borinquense]QIQ75524.1 metallophosphoesterase family protein [Halogeometricum borinquense]
MPAQLAVVSDTHIPSRAERIPDWVAERIRAADHVVHAGDFDSLDAYDRVVELAGGAANLTAVAGNIDPRSFDLPEVTTFDVEAVRFVVTHGSGPRAGYRDRVAATVHEVADSDAIGISGHTHEVLDDVVDGVRLLNPGSATGAAPADETTMYTITVEGSDVSVTLHRE